MSDTCTALTPSPAAHAHQLAFNPVEFDGMKSHNVHCIQHLQRPKKP